MYFKNNTGDEKLDNLRNAFSDLLITDLIKSKYLKVLSGDKLLNILRQLNLQEAKSYSSEDLKQVAVSGGATHILQGNYIKIAETYRIDIWLYETSTMELIDTETEEGKEENFYWMVNELTKKIKANFKLSEEEIAGDIDMASESADEDFAKGAVRAIRDIKPPKLIKSVPPIYPEKARQARVEGTVIVEARTNAQGNVEALRIIRSIPLLDQAAIDAVKQWKYEPKIIEGKARSIVFTVTVMFRLKKSKKENLAHSGQNI
jgi:TonB family protein